MRMLDQLRCCGRPGADAAELSVSSFFEVESIFSSLTDSRCPDVEPAMSLRLCAFA